jgi:serine/threonine protein phosphatase PrpC
LTGILAISRGIGNFDLKNKGLTSEPHISKYLIDEDVDYCVIASDGIWDVLKPEDVYQITKKEKNTDIIVENIVNEAIELGSEDNISCIVICLRNNN